VVALCWFLALSLMSAARVFAGNCSKPLAGWNKSDTAVCLLCEQMLVGAQLGCGLAEVEKGVRDGLCAAVARHMR